MSVLLRSAATLRFVVLEARSVSGLANESEAVLATLPPEEPAALLWRVFNPERLLQIMSVLPDEFIVKNPRIAARLFDERMLVITAGDSMLHRLNEVGTFIWSLLDERMSVKEIVASVETHFRKFERAKNAPEIIEFLDTLEKKGMVLKSKPDTPALLHA